jgi:hypothetical protein
LKTRRRWETRGALPGIAAYVLACVILGAGAWFAAGTAAAEAVPLSTESVAGSAATPTAMPTPTPSPSPTPTLTFDPTPSPTPVPTLAPEAAQFNYDIYKNDTFISQVTTHACMAGALQNMLNLIGPKVDRTDATQIQISGAIKLNTTKEDSKDGGYGPNAWAITLTQMGAGNYKLLVDDSLDQALHDAAAALRRTGRPVGLLTWYGAHSWVMTGFRSSRDPRKYSSFTVYGAYIVDPWYPRHSTIWGYAMGPDTFRNMTDMVHNYLGWKRPEGRYPSRDGKFLLVVPY